MATGHEYLPVGGFTGQVPSTSLAQFEHDVRAGHIVHVLVAVHPLTRNPDMRWVRAHCQATTGSSATVRTNGRSYARYVCVPQDAG